MNEHDESAPRARNTRKSRALKRPSRWLEKRSGAVSSRPTAIPGEPPKWAPCPAPAVVSVAAVVSAAPVASVVGAVAPAEPTFDDDDAHFFEAGDPDPGSLGLHGDETTQGQEDETTQGHEGETRRRSFSRHVLGVVVLSVVVCIAAFVRSATGASAVVAPTAASTAAVTVAEARVAPLPVPRAATLLAPDVAPAAPSVAPEVAPEPAPGAARVAREAARRSLERGAVADAIAAGTQSVELDATDAEAWLILGAAYQLAGKGAEARTAFYSCSKLAKRGNVGECRAFVP